MPVMMVPGIGNPDEHCLMSAFLVVIRDQVSVSMNQRGCSSALRFIKGKVYSGQKFLEWDS
jgi:hypothetical protein